MARSQVQGCKVWILRTVRQQATYILTISSALIRIFVNAKIDAYSFKFCLPAALSPIGRVKDEWCSSFSEWLDDLWCSSWCCKPEAMSASGR